MNRGLLIAIVLVALCLGGVVVLGAAGAAFYFLTGSAGQPVFGPGPAVTALPGPTRTPGGPPVTDAELASLDEIEQQVTELRGLESQGDFDLEFPTYEEYREITIEDFEEDYSPEEAADDGRLLTAIGVLPEGFDLYQLYIDLYSENILGSYNQETKEMYVLLVSGKLGGVERQTYAHEYVHALQDQNYGLEAMGMSDEGCEQDSERCSGVRGLVEGDATILETQWLEQFGTARDYADIAEFYQGFSSPAYDRAPCYLRDDFYWPYDDGTSFVQSLYDSGGWEAVDDAYLNPPVSSEQIMHPDAYHAGDIPEVLPRLVLTDTLGAGWRQVDANVMGEWYTQLILIEPFRDNDPTSSGYCTVEAPEASQMEEAAAGWGGDTYTMYYNEDTGGSALALLTTWDTEEDATEFEDAFADYSDARFGSAPTERDQGGLCWEAGDYGLSCLIRRGSDTLWVMAPEAVVEGVVDTVLGTP